MAIHIRRRQFIVTLGSAAAWPLAARAQRPSIDTTTPAGKALFQMMGVFAEFERSMIQERVRAGLRRAARETGWAVLQ